MNIVPWNNHDDGSEDVPKNFSLLTFNFIAIYSTSLGFQTLHQSSNVEIRTPCCMFTFSIKFFCTKNGNLCLQSYFLTYFTCCIFCHGRGGKIEQRTTTRRALFAFLSSGFAHIFGQTVYFRVNDTQQYKFVSFKAYEKRKCLTSSSE